VESRTKFGETEKAAEVRIAKAASAADELSLIQAKITKAMADLQKTQNNIDELAKTKAQLEAVKAELALKSPELAAVRDELKEQAKVKNLNAAELANLERKKFDLRLLEEARAEHLRLSGERTALNTEIATLTGQKEATQKEADRLAKSLGTVQGQLRILLGQKAELEAELAALRAATLKK
jgi:chromosome segregation ATPase